MSSRTLGGFYLSTTIHAAQKLDRRWIGIDITYFAINLIKRRLKDAFGGEIVGNQKTAGGVLITLEKPSKQMLTEAAEAGRFTSKLWHDKDYPRIQILTVEGLLNATERIDAPPQLNPFAMAARESAREKQTEML